MAGIEITNLHPTGSELFSDSESYMNDLVYGELEAIHGGWSGWKCVGTIAASVASVAVSAASSIPCATASSEICIGISAATIG